MQEMQVRSLGREDPLVKGNGNPLQYSCLGNPMDGGAWWSIVHGVTKELDSTEQLTLSLSRYYKFPGLQKGGEFMKM